MIKCGICGYTVKYRLIEHIQKTHKMDLKEYKDEYGDYVTDEYRRKISRQEKIKWKNLDFVKKMKDVRKKQFTKEVRKKMSITHKLNHKTGKEKSWSEGLTKETDERVRRIGEKNRDRYKGKPNPAHSIRMKELWKNMVNINPVVRCASDNAIKQWKKRISETLSNRISSGEINTKSNFRNGWYNGFWYSSGYELYAMKIFDKKKITWTTKHGIRLRYIGLDGCDHIYVPDFLVENKYVVEMKGWIRDDLYLKVDAGKRDFGDNYLIFYSKPELKEWIDEVFQS